MQLKIAKGNQCHKIMLHTFKRTMKLNKIVSERKGVENSKGKEKVEVEKKDKESKYNRNKITLVIKSGKEIHTNICM